MIKGHLVNAGKTNPKRTQSKPIKASEMPKQSQYKPKTNPISDGGHPSSVDRPFASGLTDKGLSIIVWAEKI